VEAGRRARLCQPAEAPRGEVYGERCVHVRTDHTALAPTALTLHLRKPPALDGYGLGAQWSDDFHHTARGTNARAVAMFQHWLDPQYEVIEIAWAEMLTTGVVSLIAAQGKG
jgi:hypothetical protein